MRKVVLTHTNGICNILIQSNLLEHIGEISLKTFQNPRRAIIVTDKNVAKFIARQVNQSLKQAGFDVKTLVLLPGERQKNLDTVRRLYDAFLTHKMDRWSPVFAVGGGIVGDIAGFASATYMRGLPFFQVPTTLLAQVDASIGGKVGVDLPQGKNLVGTFYQPQAIFIDPTLIMTLTDKEISNGLAEVVKYGIIENNGFFAFLGKNILKLLQRDITVLETIIYICTSIKARFVEQDEKDEKDLRAILNYGHTIGHAIESASLYKRFSHGEALAIGMECEAKMAVEIGLASEELLIRQNELLKKCRLPTQIKGLRAENIVKFIEQDKKVKNGKVRFALPEKIGKVKFPVFVSEKIIYKAIQYVSR